VDKNIIKKLTLTFDEIAHTMTDDKGNEVEYWLARELMPVLGYNVWDKFSNVIEKARVACEKSKTPATEHFCHVAKMIALGKSAKRDIGDVMLTRYACYLIAQNGDSQKEEIAFAQTYFALQTRRQELIEERISSLARIEAREKLRESEKRLSQNIYERGVDDAGFGRIRSRGDQALFGMSTIDMKKQMGQPESRPLADFLPAVTIAAKNLATEITNYNVEEKDLHGERRITDEHVQNNSGVRNMLRKRGIKPENLPPAEDIKKVERKVKSDEKKLSRLSGKLPKK